MLCRPIITVSSDRYFLELAKGGQLYGIQWSFFRVCAAILLRTNPKCIFGSNINRAFSFAESVLLTSLRLLASYESTIRLIKNNVCCIPANNAMKFNNYDLEPLVYENQHKYHKVAHKTLSKHFQLLNTQIINFTFLLVHHFTFFNFFPLIFKYIK